MVALLVSLFVLALTTFSLQAPADAKASARPNGFFAGKLINPKTGNPVVGATVKVFRINSDILLGQAKSGRGGLYRINGLKAVDEELDVRVNGSAIRYETGWVSCYNNVVKSWGAACSHSQGQQKPIKIQKL